MTPVDRLATALRAVVDERQYQEQKWTGNGKQTCADPAMDGRLKYVVLGEEFGEVGRALLEGDFSNLRDELVQVAAVAVAWVEALDAAERGTP